MAKNNTAKTAAPAPVKKHTVKTKGVKIRAKEDAKQYFSDKNTKPINDVMRMTDRGPELVEGLTEEQKIAEGVQLPYAVTPSFRKFRFERMEWKKVHTNAKGPVGSVPPRPKREFGHTLLIHFINTHNSKAEFVSTKCFKDVKPSEVNEVFNSVTKLKDSNDSPLNYISKYFYAGRAYKVTNGKAVKI